MKHRLFFTFIAFFIQSAILTLWVPMYFFAIMLWHGVRDGRNIDYYVEMCMTNVALSTAMFTLLGAAFTLAMASGIGRWGKAYSSFRSKEDVFAFVREEMKNVTY